MRSLNLANQERGLGKVEAELRTLERPGVIPTGDHLGNENGETKSVSLEKLHKLFPRLVNCQNGEALPDKLGSMLSSLA